MEEKSVKMSFEEAKTLVRCALISARFTPTVNELYEDINRVAGAYIPYRRFNHDSFRTFLLHCHDVCTLGSTTENPLVLPIVTDKQVELNHRVCNPARDPKTWDRIRYGGAYKLSTKDIASTTLPNERLQNGDHPRRQIIPDNVHRNISTLLREHPKGIGVVDLLKTYSHRFNETLNIHEMGFSWPLEFAGAFSDIAQLRRPDGLHGPHVMYSRDIIMDLPKVGRFVFPEWAVGPGYNMMEHPLGAYPQEPGRAFDVRVSYMESPVHFYVQLESQRSAIDALDKALMQAYTHADPTHKIPPHALTKGLLCVAALRDGDKYFCRSEILSVQATDVTIRDIDTGSEHSVRPTSVYLLKILFCRVGRLAVQATMSHLLPVERDAWRLPHKLKFRELVHKKPLELVVNVRRNSATDPLYCELKDLTLDPPVYITQLFFKQETSLSPAVPMSKFFSMYFETECE